MSPEERKLCRLLPKGYSTIRAGRGGHIQIVNPSGKLVRFLKGHPKSGLPVSVSSSPRADGYHKVIRDLKAAGVKVRGS